MSVHVYETGDCDFAAAIHYLHVAGKIPSQAASGGRYPGNHALLNKYVTGGPVNFYVPEKYH
jgi:hypothetical protein